MASVTFPPEVGGDGSTVTDDSNPTTGLKNNGHRTRFVPALAQLVAVCSYAVSTVTALLADVVFAAASVANSPNTSSTSTTSAAIGSGSKSFTIETGKSLYEGQRVSVARQGNAATHAMYGVVDSYNSATGALVVVVEDFVGTGTYTAWTISLSGFGVPKIRTVSASGLATGGGDMSANRTITVSAATTNEVRAGDSASTAVTPQTLREAAAFQVLTDAATIAWDADLGFNARVTLGGNRTMGAPTNLHDGLTYALEITQDGTGSRTMSWDAIFDWGTAGAPTLSTGTGKVDYAYGQYSSNTGKLHMTFRKAAS